MRVKDSISGLTGIVVTVSEWLNGCVRIQIQAETTKDGKPGDVSSFDEEQIEVIDEVTEHTKRRVARFGLTPQAAEATVGQRVSSPDRARTGGDRPDVTRPADPTR
jgi:hypothetical protein